MAKGKQAYIILGFGTGIKIWDLFKSLDDNSKIIIFEPNMEIIEGFTKMHVYDEMFLSSNVLITVTSDKSFMYNTLMAQLSGLSYGKIEYRITEGYEVANLGMLRDFLRVFKDVMYTKYVERNTVYFFKDIWKKNFTYNLAHIPKSYYYVDFLEKFNGMPAILVCAGPSLDKNVKELKNIKGKAVIVCVYTALTVLMKHGIIPDIVVSVDGRQTRLEEKDYVFDIPLLYSHSTDTRLLDNHKGKKILMLTTFHLGSRPIAQIMGGNDYILHAGGSVACTAVDFLNQCGFDPIVLVGQDLAFTDDKTHASGTSYGEHTKLDEKDETLITVKKQGGGTITTSIPLYTFKMWLENYFQSKSDTTFINATEGGAEIDFTTPMQLADVAGGIRQNSGVEILNDILGEKSTMDRRRINGKDVFSEIIKWVEVVVEQMTAILPRAEYAKIISEKLLLLYNAAESVKIEHVRLLISELDDFDAELLGYEDIKLYLEAPLDTLEHDMPEKDSSVSEDLYIVQKNNIMYTCIYEEIEDCLPRIRSVLEVLKNDYENSITIA